jgi:excisionase family DNA binding protein
MKNVDFNFNALGPTLLLTIEEAAELLRLGRTHTYQLVMSGRLRSVKIGRRRFITRADLEQFVIFLSEDPSKGD